MELKTLLIADDHPIFRQGLCQVLKDIAWVEVVGEAENGESALAQVRHLTPDLVLLDIAMPGMDGLEVLQHMAEQKLGSIPIVVTSYDESAYLERAFDSGARGYVLKDAAVEDIISALETVLAGGMFISPSLGKNHPKIPDFSPDLVDKFSSLTPMECKVLALVADFQTSKQIARLFDISPRTVQNHRTNICRKLDLHGMHQLMSFARENRDSIPVPTSPSSS